MLNQTTTQIDIPVGRVFESIKCGGRLRLEDRWVRTGRFFFFLEKGTSCSVCGLRGTFFRVFSSPQGNLYMKLCGQDSDGNVVPITKDHTLPRSWGGRGLDNLQPMCATCNTLKADRERLSLFDKLNMTRSAFRWLSKHLKKIWVEL